MARLLPPESAARLAAMHTTGGIPANWLAEALVSAGVPTTVIGSVRNADPMLICSPRLNVGIYCGSGGWEFVKNGRHQERKAVLALLAESAPELVHAMWTLEGGRAVADWHGPKVLTVHDTAWDYARIALNLSPVNLAYSARLLANTAATLSGYKHVIAVSPYVEQYLRRRHKFRGTIRVIPNAISEVDPQLSAPRPFPKSGVVTFGCYGGPGRIKNIPNAIRAFRVLQKRMPQSRLSIFGTGWSVREREELGGNGVVFRGAMLHHDFLRAMAEEIDVWVHPARVEAHPITICEAIQCGCAVLAGRDSGGVAWTLDSGRAGMLIDIERPAEIADAMSTAITDRVWADASIRHGRQFIRKQFSHEVALNGHLEYYREILNDKVAS